MSEKKDNKKDNNAVNSLIKGMESYVSTKTVVGEPITVGETIIIPLADVSFGMGVGQFSGNSSSGGMGGKITPSALLIISDGKSRIVSVKETDSLSFLSEMVPEVAKKVKSFFTKDGSSKNSGSASSEGAAEQAAEAAAEAAQDAAEDVAEDVADAVSQAAESFTGDAS